jgi:hypothetical protein
MSAAPSLRLELRQVQREPEQYVVVPTGSLIFPWAVASASDQETFITKHRSLPKAYVMAFRMNRHERRAAA